MQLDLLSFLFGLTIGFVVPTISYFLFFRTPNKENLKSQFEQLSQKALLDNHKHFTSLAAETFQGYFQQIEATQKHSKESINQRMQPLESLLKEMDQHLKDTNLKRTQSHTQLMEQIVFMNQLSTEVSSHAQKLTSSLRRSHAAGGWGELHLKRAVETAGMSAYCDFQQQANVKTGKTTLRPDLLIRLPNQQIIFVDAKAPIETFTKLLEATTDSEIKQQQENLGKTIKEHIKQLSNKKYWSYENLSPEFVVLFLPSEALFAAAIESDPSLIDFATQKQIVLASPTTLIGLLLTIHHGWKQERISTQATQILALAKQLVDRSNTLVSHLENIKTSISKSAQLTNQAFSSLNTRFIPKVNELSQIVLPESKIQLTHEPILEETEV